MDSKEDEEISIDFSKIKKFFKSDKTEDAKPDEASKASVSEKSAKEDEEISIDFSKIKKFFKSDKNDEKKAESHETKQKKSEGEEIELSFDISKIKKFFKSDGRETEKSDEDIPINWSKVFSFIKTYGVIFIVLIPIIFSVYIRMQAGFLHITDGMAQNYVINLLQKEIKAQNDQKYPNLPDSIKNVNAEADLQKVLQQDITIPCGQGMLPISQCIKGTSAYIKQFFQDGNGKNYMPDIDPYYWFRYSKNILDHGHPGDILKDGKPFDNHQLAPVGRFVAPDMFHEYFLAYFYKFLHLFVPDLTLMRSMFYYPVFVAALCVLLVFLIARKVAGNLGGFFAGMAMAISATFLGRTLFGHADSDAWVVFFPLIVAWLFVSSEEAKSNLKIAILIVIAGFLTALFSYVWSGWWFIFDFLLATIFAIFLYLVSSNFSSIRKDIRSVFSNLAIRNIVMIGLIYFLSTAIFVILFSGIPIFIGSFLGPLSFSSIKTPVSPNYWPNVLTTVAELNEGSLNAIINEVGGPFLFYIGMLGLALAVSRINGMKMFDYVYLILTAMFYGFYFILRRIGFEIFIFDFLIRIMSSVFGLLIWIVSPIVVWIVISIYRKDSSYDFRLSILLTLWMISTIFASIRGIRFTLLLAPAFSVAFGVALGMIYTYLSKWLTKELKIHKVIVSSILILLLLLMYIKPIKAALGEAERDIPLVNKSWDNALTAIKQNSSENAIITSWWDFGHHFKALADRPVTFDGTTQTAPVSHWVGKILMTDNETLAIGILRMIDCGSNNAFNELRKINNDTHLSVQILNEIIVLDKKGAEKKLKELGFSANQIEKILSFTHCKPPEAYFIASEDMIGKSGVWAHFGSWNFEKAEIWQNRKLGKEQQIERMIKEYNYSKEKAENTYDEIQAIENENDANTRDSKANAWVAPWPSYAGMVNCNKNVNDSLYTCPPLSIGRDNAGRDIAVKFNIDTSNYEVFGLLGSTVVKPSLVAFTSKSGIVKKELNGSNLGMGMTIIPKNENELEVVLSSKELAGSMFFRMFFMQGHGLRYFKLFNHQRGLTGTDIYTYKIDWEGKNATIIEDYVNKIVNNNTNFTNNSNFTNQKNITNTNVTNSS